MSEQTPLYPLLLTPTLHVKVWGGRKLGEIMDKDLPTEEPYGESWELHDTSTVANGPLAGRSLDDLLTSYGEALVGVGNDPSDGFPLLVKLLDAADWLSVQVHPDDQQAAELEGQPRGKTEAWYILQTDAYAKLIIGVTPGTPRELMAQTIRETRLEDVLVDADVEPGDTLYIPAGTVHAIGPGVLLYEIQQSSNTTYRLYDWGRTGLDGNPRELHIEKGVQVSNVDSVPEVTHPGLSRTPMETVVDGEFFKTTLHRVDEQVYGSASLDTNGRRFHALTCIEGVVSVSAGDEHLVLKKGRTALIPASIGAYTLSGEGQLLRSWQGD
jgi:mannose-6-phosphate isomerase